MKKFLFPVFLLLLSLMAKAQNSKMTINNHTACPAEVILYANFGHLGGWLNCELESQQFLVPPRSVSWSSYWDFHAANPFHGPSMSPSYGTFVTSYMPFSVGGGAPDFGTGNHFEWQYIFAYGHGTPGQVPGTGICSAQATCTGSVCAPHTGCMGSPHTWTMTGSDVVIDLY